MSVFTQFMTSRRPGTIKLWADWPVRLLGYQLIDILAEVRKSNGKQLRVEVNGSKLDDSLVHPEHPTNQSLIDKIAFEQRYRFIRSIAMIGDVTVHLGPRTVYAYATVDNEDTRAVLHKVQEVLEEAKRKPGTIALRTWVAAPLVALAFIAGALLFQPDQPYRSASIFFVGAAAVLYMFTALYAGLLRRVIIRARFDHNDGFWKRNSDNLAIGTISAVLAAFIVAAVAALAGLIFA